MGGGGSIQSISSLSSEHVADLLRSMGAAYADHADQIINFGKKCAMVTNPHRTAFSPSISN